MDQVFTINVDNANDPPTFTSTPVIGATEDILYTYNITTTDPDVGDNLAITALSIPAWLTLTDNLNGTATLTGTPLNPDVGSNSVVLTVTDGAGSTDNQNFTVTVANANDAPAFSSSPITAAVQDVPYTYNVSTSDPDVGDSRTIVATTLPGWLALVDNGNGTAILFGTPTNADLGANDVVLNVEDLSGAAVDQVFTINVDNANDPPIFTSTPVNSAIEDVPYAYNITTADPDVGDALVISGLTLPGWLDLQDNQDGTAIISGIPSNADVGNASVVLNVADAAGSNENQNFTITVSNTNDAPSFSSSAVTVAIQDIAYIYNIVTTDPDFGDSRIITSTVLPGWLSMMDNGNGTGVLSGTPTNADFGPNDVILNVEDASGAAVDQVFTVNVDNANDPPIFTSTPVTVAVEDQEYVYDVTSSDPDVGDNLTITSLSLPAWLTLSSTGGTATLSGTPANNDVGSNSVVLTVTDAAGSIDNQNFTINVSNTNDAPEFTSTPITAAIQDIEYNYPILASDPDIGDILAINATTLPTWLSFVDNGGGAAILNGIPSNADLGPNPVVVNVEDGSGAAVEQVFIINVNNANDPPTFTSLPVVDATEDILYQYSITATDPDQGDLLTISSLSNPAWLTLDDNGDGTASLVGTPLNNDVGDNDVAIQLQDALGTTVTQNFTIAVANTNDAPSFSSSPITVAIQDIEYNYIVGTTDVDVGDTRSLSSTSLPPWLTLTDNGDGTGNLTGTPTNLDLGAVDINLAVGDVAGAIVNQIFTINVNNTNDPPEFSSTPVILAIEDSPYEYNVTSTDPDVGDNLTIVALSIPGWLSLEDNGDGTARIFGIPLNAHVGNNNVVLNVTDAQGDVDNQDFIINVANTNDAPFFNSTPILSGQQDILYNYDITTGDVDAGDTRVIVAVAKPGWLSFSDHNNGTATLSGIPSNLDLGTHNIILNVEDADGAAVDQVFNVVVDNTNDPPTFTSTPIIVATEDLAYSYSITTLDPDVRDVISITGPSVPTWLTLTDHGDGSATLAGTPQNSNVGNSQVVLKVEDLALANEDQSFTIVVDNTNDPPRIVSNPLRLAFQDILYTYQISTTDVDLGDTRTITATTLPGWLSLVDNLDGTAILSGTPSNADFGDNPVTLRVEDLAGLVHNQSFTIVVDNANDPPAFTSSPVLDGQEDSLYQYTITVTDPDVGDVLTFNALTLPSWLTFEVLDSRTARLLGIPSNSNVGLHSVILNITDLLGLSVNQDFEIEVGGTNDVPQFLSEPITAATEGLEYSYDVNSEDVDGDELTLSVTTIPNWLSFSTIGNGIGNLSGIPGLDDIGVENRVILVVIDSKGAQSVQEFTIDVDYLNQPPTLDIVANPQPVPEDSPPQTIQLTGISAGNDEDQSLSLLVSFDNPGLIDQITVSYINPDSIGSLTYSFRPDSSGTTAITVTALDDGADNVNNTSLSFLVEVVAVNDTPHFISTPITVGVANESYDYAIQVVDNDPQDQLFISAMEIPTWLTLQATGPGGAVLSGQVPPSSDSPDEVVLVVEDPSGARDTQSFLIKLNTTPLVSDLTGETFEDETLDFSKENFEAGFQDEDDDLLQKIVILTLPLNGTLILDGTPVQINQEIGIDDLSKLTYVPVENFNGNDQFQWNGYDGNVFADEPSLYALHATPVNDPPILANLETDTLKFSQGGEPLLLTNNITINDIDNSNISSALVIVSENFVSGEDMLVIEGLDSIESNFDDNSGVLTLIGIASKSAYESIFHSIRYINTNLNTTSDEVRTIAFVVSDLLDESNQLIRALAIVDVFLPIGFVTAFTPNDDGVNDTWNIQNLESYENFDLIIFDNDGNIIFRTQNSHQEWDGTMDGQVLPPETYHYTLKVNDGDRQFRGIVTILKQ